jgi:alpha,alpha-trehalase
MHSEHQAKNLVEIALPQGRFWRPTKQCNTNFPEDVPQRQWDYPFAGALHQILLWEA